MDRTLLSIKSSTSAVFLKKDLCESKRRRTFEGVQSIFTSVFGEQQGEKGRRQELAPKQNLRQMGCWTLPTTVLTPKITDDA